MYILNKIINQKTNIILFDECEDSLCYDSLKEKMRINKILDENKAICIFLSNSKDMDEAYLRRFDIILELKAMPKENKIKNIKELFKNKNINIDKNTLELICTNSNLSQGVILKCANSAKIFKEKSQKVFVDLINENLKARSLPILQIKDDKKDYNLNLIECDFEIKNLMQNINSSSSIRILNYGIAESGKSEFAKELAKHTNKALHSYKMSDILDAYVGNSEKN